MSKALNLRLRRVHELTMKKKEDAIPRRIVTDILQFGSVCVVSALTLVRWQMNSAAWLGTPFFLAIVIPT